MIFENYRIIILINLVLVFFLVISIVNIILLNIHYKFKEKRILALLFFSSSNLPIPQTAKKHLLEMVNTKKGSEFYHAASLLALNWPNDYGITVISAINSDDSMTMNLKLAVARKIKVFIEYNFSKLFQQLDHNMEAKFFMIETAGVLKIKSAIPILKNLFKEGSFEVMLRSMKALSDLDCKEMTDEFWEKYEKEEDVMFKTLFFKSFLGIADKTHISRIVKEINNRNWFVRYAAAKKLAKMGDEGKNALFNCRGNDACELALAESGFNKAGGGAK
jgi:hypothetical protein